jgi:hypothetical protein
MKIFQCEFYNKEDYYKIHNYRGMPILFIKINNHLNKIIIIKNSLL